MTKYLVIIISYENQCSWSREVEVAQLDKESVINELIKQDTISPESLDDVEILIVKDNSVVEQWSDLSDYVMDEEDDS